MTTASRLALLPARLLVPLLVAAAALVGLAATRDARLAFAAAAAAVFLAFVLVDLPVAVGAWVAILFLAGVPGTQGGPTGTSVLLLAGWAGTLAERGPEVRVALRRARWPLAAAALVLLWSALSLVWAAD
ncbi:hypothetical protein ACVU7I_17525, partial [Patulibacter sp. S7RM1-6]